MTTAHKRQYEVTSDDWRDDAISQVAMRLGHLAENDQVEIQVAIKTDGGAKLTLTTCGIGVEQAVLECDIPLKDADALLKRCKPPVDEMMRHLVLIDGFTWQVDVYRGTRRGEVTARLEVNDPETWPDPLPPWIGSELP